MALTDEEKLTVTELLDDLADRRVPVHVRDKYVLQYQISRHDVVLLEKRPYYRDPSQWIESPVAKFRLNRKAGLWELFCRDRNSKWHRYEPLPSAGRFANLVAEVDEDPTGIFWG